MGRRQEGLEERGETKALEKVPILVNFNDNSNSKLDSPSPSVYSVFLQH
jgi:hypothetical protein